ncbi:multidrug effflux MFS transporter [Roseomonas sp. OT10]|uniref:multidrug effflux MFS transporter n=1 Tax=Roseomonas cutis TaxID=2897332 RepID=UPI001E2E37AF|nr:multidrug effflux MFS transporter [Roseomonas sp. OT10]UFN49599.1 multidrug effflux MFS transporter [Roseomonas sp. OT10]
MPSWLPLLLGFLTAIGPISTDMYLPAFPAIEASLHSAAGTAQVTLATWFLGLACGQIVQGSLADRFGRRAPLLVGTAIYTAASIGCALATDMASLSLFRLLAALGGSASAVIPRAVVRDLTEGLASARLMSRLMLVMGVAPILAPTLGGLLLDLAGWRAIFWVSAAYGLASTLLVWRLLPDTLPVELRTRLGATGLLARYIEVARDRSFMAHALLGGAAMFTVFAFISAAPALFINGFGLSPRSFALLFAVTASGFIGASQLNPWLVARFGPGRVITGATLTAAAAVLLLLAGALTGIGGLPGIFVPAVLALATSGLILPNAAVGALARHGARAGSASALLGTLQYAMAAMGSMAVGLIGEGRATPMALVMLLGVLLALAADAWRRR